MKRICLAVILCCSGCSVFNTDEDRFIEQRTTLNRDIQLLELKRRKLGLQLSISKLEKKQDQELTGKD